MGQSAHCHFDGHFNLEDKDVQAFVKKISHLAWEYSEEEDAREENGSLQWMRDFTKDENDEISKIPVTSHWRDKGPYRFSFGGEEFNLEVSQLIKEEKIRLVYLGGAGRDGEQWGPDEDHPYSNWFE